MIEKEIAPAFNYLAVPFLRCRHAPQGFCYNIMKHNKAKSPGDQVQYRYQKLIFFLNRRCTVGCSSCNAAAAPGNRGELPPEWLIKFFNKVRQEELTFSGYVIWSGGEPFLTFEALNNGIGLASGCGYRSEILTSGAWFDSHPGYLEQLAETGHFSIRISLDSEHQEKVPLELVFALIERALQLNIEVNFTLRQIPGRSESAAYYIKEIEMSLPEFYRQSHSNSRWIHVIPHVPTAPAGMDTPSRETGKSLPSHQRWQRPCQQGFKDLVIGEDGYVYPCCGLFTLSCYPRMRIGDPLKEAWHSLAGKQNRNPLFGILQEKGPYHICRELGFQPETWSWSPYQDTCCLCLALFNRRAEQVLSYYSL